MVTIPTIEMDFDAATDCRALLVALSNAIIALNAGNTRLKVRHNERWTEYNPGKSPALMQLFETVWAQCPDKAGLINLSPAARAIRGAPARMRIW